METALELAARMAQKARMLAVWSLTNNLPQPLIYCDIGALWGVDNEYVTQLNQLGRLRVVGFEPDQSECDRLMRANPGNIYLPFGIGDVDQARTFYVTAFNACASFLEPDLSAFPGLPHAGMYRVVRTLDLTVRRLDSLIREQAVPQPDFLKIDAQGFESAILQGCGAALDSIVGLRFETQLRPIYKGRATFFALYELLRARDFILRDLRVTHSVAYKVVELEAFFLAASRHECCRRKIASLGTAAHSCQAARCRLPTGGSRSRP